MSDKKHSTDSETAGQYRMHLREHRAAQARYDAAMDSAAESAAWESLAGAVARIRDTHPDEAKAIADAVDTIVGTWSDAHDALADAWYHECCRRALAPDVVATKKAARKARARWSDDPIKQAKAAAVELWPVAHRRGWTATKFHAELVAKGHTVKADTVRKWVTALRKTGIC